MAPTSSTSSSSWAPPRPAPPARSPSTAAIPSSPPLHLSTPASFLSTPSGELALFRALVSHRLVGPTKHWDMVGVLTNLRAHVPAERLKGLRAEDVWSKYAEMYSVETLERVWEEQQEQLLPTPTPSPAASHSGSAAPSPSPSRGGTPSASATTSAALPLPAAASTTSSARASPAFSAASSAMPSASQARILATFFPPRDFSLSQPLPANPSSTTADDDPEATPHPEPKPAPERGFDDDSSALPTLAFERGRLPPSAPRESPVPDDAPLREVSVPAELLPPPASPAAGRKAKGKGRASPKKRAATGGGRGSPRKRARRDAEEEDGGGGEDEESELSELSGEEESDGEGEEGEGEGEEEEDEEIVAVKSEEGEEEDDEDGPLTGEEEDEDEEEEGGEEGEEGDNPAKAAKDKAAAIRALPSSKRTTGAGGSTRRGRSASVAPSVASTSGGDKEATPTKPTSTTSTRTGTRSSARKAGGTAGGRKRR
ncbi:hypothetical protein JCM6882_000595 [Rhodosporidiobolus microsporus]